MKKTLAVALSAAFAIAAISAPALAGPPEHGEKAFGAGIKFHCGASYGQLVAAAKDAGHVSGAVSGAKAFATEPLDGGPFDGMTRFEIHCLPQ